MIWRAGTSLYALPLAGGAPALLTATAAESLTTMVSVDGRQVIFLARGDDASAAILLYVAQLPPNW